MALPASYDAWKTTPEENNVQYEAEITLTVTLVFTHEDELNFRIFGKPDPDLVEDTIDDHAEEVSRKLVREICSWMRQHTTRGNAIFEEVNEVATLNWKFI